MVGLIAYIILLAPHTDTVTATTYKLTVRENGPYGNNMASGYKVSYKYPGNNRVIAVSPDLLKKFPYHTDVIIKGAGSLDGEYKVEDVMSKRWHSRIDILLNWKTKNNKFNNIIITSHGQHQSHSRNIISRSNDIHNVRTKQSYKRIKKRSSRGKKTKYHSTRQSFQHKRRARKISNGFRNAKRR